MLQRLTAGIGNIYKSESLFVARVNPWTTVAELGDEGTLRVLLVPCRRGFVHISPALFA